MRTIPTRHFAGCVYRLDPTNFRACLEAFIRRYWVLFGYAHRQMACPKGTFMLSRRTN